LEANRAALRESLFDQVQSIRVALESLRARAHLALAAQDLDRSGPHLALARQCGQRLSAQGLPASAAHGALTFAAIAALDGDVPTAVARTRVALAGFEERQMALHVASARFALARLVGGDEGQAMDRAAHAAFEAAGVVAPLRFANHYAPGFATEK
jgi:hypothetical protein